jgi:hypothetical protein
MSEQMFNIASRISAKLDIYAIGVRFKVFMVVNAFGQIELIDNQTSTGRSVGVQHVVPSFSSTYFWLENFAATIAAAATLSFCSGCFPACRRTVAKIAPQQFAPVLWPRLCQYGGASRICRRFLWRKSRHSVAAVVPAAAHFGDNFAFFANAFHNLPA